MAKRIPAPAPDFHDLIVIVNEHGMQRLAATLAAMAVPGDVFCLHGELGAGKTTFSRYFLRALGHREEVPSPTFNLMFEYETRKGLVCHMDLYRLERPEDAFEIGIEEQFEQAICLLEWPERLAELLPDNAIHLDIQLGQTVAARQVELRCQGAAAARLAACLGGDGDNG